MMFFQEGDGLDGTTNIESTVNSPDDQTLWDGIFWLEACMAVCKSVECFQLGTIMEGVREEAFKAGILVVPPSNQEIESTR